MAGKLGWAPYDSSGWCTIIIIDPVTLEKDYFVAVVGYDLWIYIALFLVPIMYFAVRSFLREEVRIAMQCNGLIKLKLRCWALL